MNEWSAWNPSPQAVLPAYFPPLTFRMVGQLFILWKKQNKNKIMENSNNLFIRHITLVPMHPGHPIPLCHSWQSPFSCPICQLPRTLGRSLQETERARLHNTLAWSSHEIMYLGKQPDFEAFPFNMEISIWFRGCRCFTQWKYEKNTEFLSKPSASLLPLLHLYSCS